MRRVKVARHVTQLVVGGIIVVAAVRHQLETADRRRVRRRTVSLRGPGDAAHLGDHGNFVTKIHPSNLVLGLGLLVGTLLVGNAFCGWICPFGAVQDALSWVRRQLHLPDRCRASSTRRRPALGTVPRPGAGGLHELHHRHVVVRRLRPLRHPVRPALAVRGGQPATTGSRSSSSGWSRLPRWSSTGSGAATCAPSAQRSRWSAGSACCASAGHRRPAPTARCATSRARSGSSRARPGRSSAATASGAWTASPPARSAARSPSTPGCRWGCRTGSGRRT